MSEDDPHFHGALKKAKAEGAFIHHESLCVGGEFGQGSLHTATHCFLMCTARVRQHMVVYSIGAC